MKFQCNEFDKLNSDRHTHSLACLLFTCSLTVFAIYTLISLCWHKENCLFCQLLFICVRKQITVLSVAIKIDQYIQSLKDHKLWEPCINVCIWNTSRHRRLINIRYFMILWHVKVLVFYALVEIEKNQCSVSDWLIGGT